METTATHTMQAVTQGAYGGPEVFAMAELERPAPGPREVLVRVAYAGVDRGTWHIMTGLPLMARPVLGMRRPRQVVPGLDLAGTVVAVGNEVTRFAPGDEVFGIGRGSFAQYAVALERKLVHRPAEVAAEAAAVVPVSGLTAIQALDLAGIEDGPVAGAGAATPRRRVLVLGASGGVGHFAVQLAAARGAHVTAVCSAAKADFVRELGADVVLDYAAGDPVATDAPYDAIIDIAGDTPLPRLRRALARTGALVIIGSEGPGRIAGGMGRQLRATLLSPFTKQRLAMLVSAERHEDLERLAAALASGAVAPHVDRALALTGIAEAINLLEAGRVRGKLAVRVGE